MGGGSGASTKQEWGFSEPYSTFYHTDYNLFSYLNTQMFQFKRNPWMQALLQIPFDYAY